jgi:hypothetical protein
MHERVPRNCTRVATPVSARTRSGRLTPSLAFAMGRRHWYDPTHPVSVNLALIDNVSIERIVQALMVSELYRGRHPVSGTTQWTFDLCHLRARRPLHCHTGMTLFLLVHYAAQLQRKLERPEGNSHGKNVLNRSGVVENDPSLCWETESRPKTEVKDGQRLHYTLLMSDMHRGKASSALLLRVSRCANLMHERYRTCNPFVSCKHALPSASHKPKLYHL